ncbi:hypothetical protein PS627_01080 [Pseudomonas fluorescens]|uniref:hypothetical protein n=1 Tax=Pseudomonas fluorescens TaxID=294 RepID=UPI001259324D|nr:hypothetical protein [Pseudomonas fluorescens]CAG8864538.1 hypothetical protein PS627_01080 [Pseudomonas fluorescens]VVP72630.1 hypothetical protein PS910_01121 [Pseudomonas fluorescens]
MKKIVPDPPAKLITTPYFSIHSEMIPPDALAHASELLRGVEDTLDQYRRGHAAEPRLNMLANVLHSTEMARVLVEHALQKM